MIILFLNCCYDNNNNNIIVIILLSFYYYCYYYYYDLLFVLVVIVIDVLLLLFLQRCSNRLGWRHLHPACCPHNRSCSNSFPCPHLYRHLAILSQQLAPPYPQLLRRPRLWASRIPSFYYFDSIYIFIRSSTRASSALASLGASSLAEQHEQHQADLEQAARLRVRSLRF